MKKTGSVIGSLLRTWPDPAAHSERVHEKGRSSVWVGKEGGEDLFAGGAEAHSGVQLFLPHVVEGRPKSHPVLVERDHTVDAVPHRPDHVPCHHHRTVRHNHWQAVCLWHAALRFRGTPISLLERTTRGGKGFANTLQEDLRAGQSKVCAASRVGEAVGLDSGQRTTLTILALHRLRSHIGELRRRSCSMLARIQERGPI